MTFLSMVIVLLATSSGAFTATYPSYVNLEDYCGRTVTLPCPNSQGSAGTVRFYMMPSSACQVTVTTSSSCGSFGDTYAIYFNIRKSYMPVSSSMEIYDTSVSRTLEKQWSGGDLPQLQYTNPTSAGQSLSKYARQPEISVEFTPSSVYPPTVSHEVFFDYVIIEGQSSSYSTYCSALSGYVNDDFICDTTNDRVNCPSRYSDQTYAMDQAIARQYCDQPGYRTTRSTAPTRSTTTRRSTTTEPYYFHTNTGLSGGAIAGIIFGCAGFVALVGGIVACVACATCGKRSPRVTEAQTVAFTNNNYTAAPSVTITTPGAPPPYPTQMYATYPPPDSVATYAQPPTNNVPQK